MLNYDNYTFLTTLHDTSIPFFNAVHPTRGTRPHTGCWTLSALISEIVLWNVKPKHSKINMFPEQSQHMRWRMHCGQDSQHRMQDAPSGKQNSVFHYWVWKHKYVFSKSRDCPRTCTHPCKKINAENQKWLLQRCWITGGCPTPAPLWTPLDLKHNFFPKLGDKNREQTGQ